MSWSVSHSRRSLISCQSPGLEINFHRCRHVLLQPLLRTHKRKKSSKWLSSVKSQNVFFFSSPPSASYVSFHSGEYAAYASFFSSFFYWSRIPFHVRTLLRDTIQDIQLKRLKKASDRQKFHVKCNFIMLIYQPNLNLNCGRLCSIMFASPAFKDCQKKKIRPALWLLLLSFFFFRGNGMRRPGVRAERQSGKAESCGR